jgi:general secretion pathway protein L
MATFLGDLFLWFVDVWSQMRAGLVGRRAPKARRQQISLGASGIRLEPLDALQQGEIIEMPDLCAELQRIGRQHKSRPQECALRLEEGRALVRRLSPIALPASRLRAAALLDLETATPFRTDDVHALVMRARGSTGLAGSNYAIVKRAILDPLIEACTKANRTIGQIDIVSAAQVYSVSDSDLRRLAEGAGRPGKGWRRALMLVTILSGMGTLAHFSVQYDGAIRQAENHAEELAVEAKAVRTAMEQQAARIAEIQALRTSIEERKLVSAIWEELARVLPDSSFLTDLAVKEETVSISGYSAAASSIIVALEGSDLFDQASFTAPVVKVPGNEGDRFAIDLKMGGK